MGIRRMAGHSHWKQIKTQKGAADQKRGELFSKLLRAISVAARGEANPDFNPRLKAAILKAQSRHVPYENIERAIHKSHEEKSLEEMVIEAYGPGGVALVIEAITDNKNRTVAEIKRILNDHGARMATPGGVLWSFKKDTNSAWQSTFSQIISPADREKLPALLSALEGHEDVQRVTTNSSR